MSELTCPRCGTQNRAGARFCQQCGGSLTIYELASSPPASAAVIAQPEPVTAGPIVLEGLVQAGARYVPVGKPMELAHSIYHHAHGLTCAICHHANPAGALKHCQQCQATLPMVLLRQARRKLSSDDAHNVVALSEFSPFILRHLDVVHWPGGPSAAGGDTYLVLARPTGFWSILVKAPMPVEPAQVVAWTIQLGEALVALHKRGFALHEVNSAGLEGIIIDGDAIRLADLSSATRLSIDDPTVVHQQSARDTVFLAQFIHYLSTGYDLKRQPAIERLPLHLRQAVERGVRGGYDNVAAMLTELSRPATSPATFIRSLRQGYGVATHAGQTHEHNEDAVIVFNFVREPGPVPVGFYLLADGMGGQEAGEIASETINRIVAQHLLERQVIASLTKNLTESPEEILRQAIGEANRTVLEMNQGNERNMGAVVVMALIINDRAVIANVGDSRAYLVRGAKLRQITSDHSVVARLVETGAIEPDQVRTHPSRNQVYRSLGEKSTVEIDVHSQLLQAGDRLLLCCDGLWEMLLDEHIQRIVTRATSPQAACDDLIRAANIAGGEDNISVIVIQME